MVTMRTFVAVLVGPNCFGFGLSAWVVVTVADDDDDGFGRVLPSKFRALSSSSSSYQLECLVASFVRTSGAAPAPAPVSAFASFVVLFVVDVEDAVTAAFFRRRLICRPSSSSDDVNPESESDEAAAAAGGVAARLRKFALAFADRFLNVTCGISAGVSTVVFSSVMVADCCSNDGTRVDQDSWLIRNHLV